MLSTGISVAHSNDAIARTFQEPSPRLVVASLRFSIVHVPLELDHNPFTGAIEIHNKAVQYVLSPKLEPEDSAVAQQRPGVTLSWRRVVAQLAGARKSLGRAETTKRIHLPERAAQRNDLRNQNPAERSEKKLTLRSPSPGGRGGQGVRTRLLDTWSGIGSGIMPCRLFPLLPRRTPYYDCPMDIKRAGSQPSSKGPADWFTGTVRVDPLFQARDPARAAGASVTFEPGARTAWHTHPLGQTLIVVFGAGRVQRWGEPIEEIRPGDVIWFSPGEKHWHGASPTTALTHIAIQEQLDGKAVEWMEKVSDEQYHAGANTP